MLLPASAFAEPVWEKPIEGEVSDIHKFAQEEIKKIMAGQEKPKLDENFKPSLKGEKVVLMIELKDEAAIIEATRRGVKVSDLPSADAIAGNLLLQQDLLEEEIKALGIDFEKQFNYTNVINAISIKTDISNLEIIKSLAPVKSVAISNSYYAPTESATPRMLHSHEMIDDEAAWAKGIKGQGTIVAVLDSGFDVNNKDMVITEPSRAKLGESEARTIIDQIGYGQYINVKFPYAYNYFDKNDDVYEYNTNTSHGVHVSGTVGANGFIKGVAPEAQILAMRVFSNDPLNPSVQDYHYVKAFDDAVKLGADVINMSLGSSASFYDENNLTNLAITNAVENGIVFAVAAGNDGASLSNPTGKTPDYGTVGAPSVYKDALSVASINNNWLSQQDVILAGDKKIPYGVSGTAKVDGLKGKEFELGYVGLGYKYTSETDKTLIPVDDKYANVELEGKVALIQRGGSTFTEKVLGAQKRGAVAAIVFNSEVGGDAIMGMILDNTVNIPALFVGFNDGLHLTEEQLVKFASEKYDVTNPAGGQMSDFSSWGSTPSLNLKPEITAPGGSIYSHANDNEYYMMNGTSMATPHVAGGMALVKQYINENPRLSTLNINGLPQFVLKHDLPRCIYLIGDKAYALDLINTKNKDILVDAIIKALEEGVEIFRYSADGEWFTYSGERIEKQVLGSIYYTNVFGIEKKLEIGQSTIINSDHSLTKGDTTRLVEILLMNTAEPVINPDNFPYSPRKQGAGIMQVNKAIETPVVLVNATDNRPKVELFDFDEKEFTMNLRAINTTNTEQTYNLETIVLQDYIDEKGFNYKVSDFVDADIDAEEIITVPAGGYKDFSIKVDFSDADSVYEGMFIEGFVRLKHRDGKTPTIGLPFMGYYGKWSQAPIVDSFNPDEAVFAFGGRFKWGGAYIGELYDSKSDELYVDLLGNPDGNLMTEDYAYISGNPTEYTKLLGRGKIGVLFGLLRNVNDLQVGIKDSTGNYLGSFYNFPFRYKGRDSDNNPYISLMDPPNLFLFDGKFGSEVLPDGKYEYVIKAKAHYQDAEYQEVSKVFHIDSTKPSLNGISVKDGILTFNAEDNGSGLLEAYITLTGKDNKPIGKLTHKIEANGLQSVDLTEFNSDEYFVNILLLDRVGNWTESGDLNNVEDTKRPFLLVTSPGAWEYFTSKTITIKGHVFDVAEKPEVLVNGKEAKVWFEENITVKNRDGDVVREGNAYSFEMEISFENEGYNKLEVEAVSKSGKNSRFVREIFIDETEPEIKVDYTPVVYSDTTDITVTFSDTTSNYIKLFVNGRDYGWFFKNSPENEMTGASFTKTITLNLKLGENAFEIKAVDDFGNIKTETINITRQEEAIPNLLEIQE